MRLRLLLILIGGWVVGSLALAAPEIRVFTTEYPPYAASGLAHQGAAVRMLREVLGSRYRVQVDFLPWARLARELGHGRYDLVLLAWPGDLRQHGLTPSSPWFVSRLGFYVRREQLRARGASIRELQGQRVGVVRDYAYPPLLLAAGLQLEPGNSDEQNLRKLAARRFDYVAVEHAVGRYLLNQQLIAGGSELLAWQEPAFAELPIHVGVVPGRSNSAALLLDLEQGLQAYKRDGSYRRLLQQHHLDGVPDVSTSPPVVTP